MERARWRFTANYRLLDRLQVGVEFNAVVEEINPLVTLFILTETEKRPSIFLGTSSDRIGSPKGATAYYATVTKGVQKTGTSAYFSRNYSEWDEELNLPFGISQDFTRGFAGRYMYDGVQSHALLDYYFEKVGVSFMYVWLEQFGVALHGGF